MPQIAQISEIFASQLFWLTISFGLIFVIVGLGMVPKIQGTVDARDARIAADLATAASARETADRLEAEHRAALDKSRTEAAAVAAENFINPSVVIQVSLATPKDTNKPAQICMFKIAPAST